MSENLLNCRFIIVFLFIGAFCPFLLALGVVADGIIGEVTLQAAAEASPAVVINTLTQRRTYFLRALSTFPTFGRGWMSRVNGVRKLALAMAKQNPTDRKED